ncbi:MAG: hypothetical protein M3Y72_08220 [Acidobacteriota bacterium]|nr:hypothetical protein [Acidobacteriota bacterium]
MACHRQEAARLEVSLAVSIYRGRLLLRGAALDGHQGLLGADDAVAPEFRTAHLKPRRDDVKVTIIWGAPCGGGAVVAV